MKKVVLLLVFLILVLTGFPGPGDAECQDAYYWAQGRKVYLDAISDHYLALYEPESEEQQLHSLQSQGLIPVDTPSHIILPSGACLVHIEKVVQKGTEQLGLSLAGLHMRSLIPAYRDRLSGEMVLLTDTIIVRFRKNVDETMARSIMAQTGLTEIQKSPYGSNQYTGLYPAMGISPLDTANALSEMEEVVFSHPDMIKGRTTQFIPNDPLYQYQWHLDNSGQLGGTSGADIRVEDAWDVTRGSLSVLIGILDDGTMKDHEDLQANYVAGKNYLTGTDDPTPSSGTGESEDWHGTSTAGLAVAKNDNGKGLSGACPDCGLVAVRYGALVSQDAQAFYWFDQQGVAVCSNSWSYVDDITPDSVYYAIQDVALNGRNGLGMLVFFAAGNDSRQIPTAAVAGHPYVMAIGASTDKDLRAWYSNFGNNLSVVAPSNGGVSSISTTDVYPPVGDGYNIGGDSGSTNFSDGRYTNDFGGTSASCPLAAGVAGLLLSVNADLNRSELKRILEYTADKIGSILYGADGRNAYYGYGRINASKAVWGAKASLYDGWWYNPDESGSGIAIETQGTVIFLAWYTYDAYSGEPIWFTSGGEMSDDSHYSGSLLSWTGWPLGSNYSAPQSQSAGTVSIIFSSSDQAQVSWTLGDGQGQKSIVKFMDDVSPGTSDYRDIQGWWYDPSFDGMGIYLEAKGGNLFLAWYHYGSNGNPRWWSSGGTFAQGAEVYSGVLDQWENGQCIGCTYTSPQLLAGQGGSISIQFLNDSEAVLTWSGGQLNLERFLFGYGM